MNCVFCGESYDQRVGCCATAAISLAITALRYHVECDCDEVGDALAQLERALEVATADNDELGHCFVSRGPNGTHETDHCVRCYCERYEGDDYYGGCRP